MDVVLATTKDPTESHASMDKKPTSPAKTTLKIRAIHRKTLTSDFASSDKNNNNLSTPSNQQKKAKCPFLMLCLRKVPTKKEEELRYMTVDGKGTNNKVKEEVTDFKKDLEEYIEKKDGSITVKGVSINKMATFSKEAMPSAAEKFLFSSKDALPLSMAINMERETTSQRTHYQTGRPKEESKKLLNDGKKTKILSLEKLVKQAKEKQCGLRVSFDPSKVQSGLKQSTIDM